MKIEDDYKVHIFRSLHEKQKTVSSEEYYRRQGRDEKLRCEIMGSCK